MDKAKTYTKIKDYFGIFGIFWQFLFLIIMILWGSKLLKDVFLNVTTNFYGLICIYIIGFLLLAEIFNSPLSFTNGYIIEHKFGLSCENIFGWLKRQGKHLLLNLIITSPLVLLLYFLLRSYPYTWWIIAGISYFFISLLLSRLLPLIIPFFYKLYPLANNELKQGLIDLTQKANFKISGIYKIELSKETKKANAAFVGLGRTKRILLADTLLDNFSNDEIESVCAHELGHFIYKHLLKNIILSAILTVLTFYAAKLLIPIFINKFSQSIMTDIINFPVIVLVFSIFVVIFSPLVNSFSRKLEYQADSYAIKTKGQRNFINAMNKLAELDLVDKTPPSWREFLFHSHPSISRRISKAKSIN